VLVLVGVPILKARKIAIPPVSKVGKYGSFLTSLCFGVFVASGITDIHRPNGALHATGLALFFAARR